MSKSVTGPAASPSWTPADAPIGLTRRSRTSWNGLGQLWVSRYEPSVDRGALREVARIDYLDAAGNSVGHTELLRSDASGEPVYYLATEHTRVPITLISGAAERLDQDLAQLL